MQEIKILHINTYDLGGGAEQFALSLSKASNGYLLVKKKLTDNSHVIEFEKKLIDKLFIFLDKILWNLGIKKTFKQLFFLSEEFNQTYKKLKKLKEYKEAEIIHFHNLHGGYFDIKAIKKIATEKKIVWTLHDFWTITGGEVHFCNHQDISTPNTKSLDKAFYPLNNPILDRRKYYSQLKKNIYNSYKHSIYFVAPSFYVLKTIKKSPIIPRDLTIKLIYNGIDTNMFYNKKQRNWNIPKLLFFNSSSPFKYSVFFLKILKKINFDVEIHVFGEVLEFSQNNLKIVNHGFISNREKLSSLYNQTDILIFPSHRETFGLIPLEATMCGTYVLASDIPAIREQASIYPIHLFDNNNEDSFLSDLKALCKNLNETRKKAELASKISVKAFSFDKTYKEYVSLYENIINQ